MPYIIPSDTIKIVDPTSFWNDLTFGPGSSYQSYENNFFSWIPTEWTVTEVGSGTQTIADEAGGALLLTNAAADNDAITLQLGGTADGAATSEAFLPASGKNIWVEAKLKISDATQSDFLFGLVNADTTPLANTNGIYFRKDDGDTQIDFESNSSSVASTASNIFTATTSYVLLGFKVVGLEKIEYWVNGIKIGEITSQIPTTEMRLTFHIQNGEAVAKTMSIGKVKAIQQVS